MTDIRPKNMTKVYTAGMATAVTTILLSYAYCFTDKDTAHIISTLNIAINLLVMLVFRKYLQVFGAGKAVASVDWFLAIGVVICLSATTDIVLHKYGNARYKDLLEIMAFFDFLVYCTYLVITIQIGMRIKRLTDETGLLVVLGNLFIYLLSFLFIVALFMATAGTFKTSLPLHILLTTLAQLPVVVLILIFYKAKRSYSTALV